MKVLIIEDNEIKTKECLSTLEPFQAECTVVSNEREAKMIIKSCTDFDLVLLDMELDLSSDSSEGKGNYSGLSILNTMKYSGIQIPVIVITVYRNFSQMKTTVDPNNLLFLYNDFYFQPNCNKEVTRNFDTCYLEGLHDYMSYRYKNYVGVVEYSIYNSAWKKRLQKIITDCMEKKKHENTNY